MARRVTIRARRLANDEPQELLPGFAYVVDELGRFLVDADGRFIIVQVA